MYQKAKLSLTVALQRWAKYLVKIEKIKQNYTRTENLISAFALFLTIFASKSFLEGTLDTRLCPHLVLWFF